MSALNAAYAARNLTTLTRSRQHWWARSFTGLRPISIMASPPTVTVPVATTSAINASNNAASLPTSGLYANLNTAGYLYGVAGTGNPNNNRLQAGGPNATDGGVMGATLVRCRFTITVPQFEVCFTEVTGCKINAIVDGSLVTAGGVGVIPNPLQSGGTRYMQFNFGSDVVSYGMASQSVSAAGTGYVGGDTVTMSGGTFTRAATFRVGFATGGTGVGNLYIQDPGDYTVLPTFPAATTSSGAGTGCTIASGFVFPRHTTFKPREIELLISGAYLFGVNYTAPASGEPAITPYAFNPRVPSLYWVDDSQGANTYGTYAGGEIGFLVATRLGLVDNLTIDARPGTGFSVVSSTIPAFEHANRINAIISANPDFIFVPFSQNVGTQVATTAAAVAWVQAVQAGLPNAKIVVGGPALGHQSWHATAIAAMLAAAPIPANIRSIDSIGEAWDAGGAAGFLTSDTTHWGQYGNLEWRSKLLAQHIANALLSMIP